MYRVFAVKTRKNAIHYSVHGDERAKRRVLAVRTAENAALAAFRAIRTAETRVLTGFNLRIDECIALFRVFTAKTRYIHRF